MRFGEGIYKWDTRDKEEREGKDGHGRYIMSKIPMIRRFLLKMVRSNS